MEIDHEGSIFLLPLKGRMELADLPKKEGQVVLACDFYLQGAEKGLLNPWGWDLGHVKNIDHHAPVAEMARYVSSANLALEYVTTCERSENEVVVINHTDCDSILSAGIMSGRLAPLDKYGEAAIAADHTGVANPIADLLQSLDDERDILVSFDNLNRLENREALRPKAQAALDERLRARERARRMVAEGQFTQIGKVAYATTMKETDGEFFPGLLPEAAVIIVAVPRKDRPEYWQMKVRLGLGAPLGANLFAMGVQEYDPGFGGRWNAGSTKRSEPHEGQRDPATWAYGLAQKVNNYLAGLGARDVSSTKIKL